MSADLVASRLANAERIIAKGLTTFVEVGNALRRIRDEQKVSILLVEQNARIALQLADTAYLLETGRIVKHGSSQEMRNDDAVRRAYLGE